MNILRFLCILLAVSSFINISQAECIHDQLDIQIDELKDEEVDPQGSANRFLASNWGPLRIIADFTHFSGPSSTKSYIQNKLLPPIFDYFAATLNVSQLSSLSITQALSVD